MYKIYPQPEDNIINDVNVKRAQKLHSSIQMEQHKLKHYEKIFQSMEKTSQSITDYKSNINCINRSNTHNISGNRNTGSYHSCNSVWSSRGISHTRNNYYGRNEYLIN